MIKAFFIIGVLRSDFKQCGKMPDANQDMNQSICEIRIYSGHSMKSFVGMGS